MEHTHISISDNEFLTLTGYIKGTYGINLQQKRGLLEGRLNNYLVRSGYKSYADYILALKNDTTGREITNLLNKVTTNHTFFMRESEHFEFLRTTVLPQLECNVHDRDLRIWCAASSSGEEPYTLAMILEDYFGGKRPEWDKRLLASDLSQEILEKAIVGVYPNEGIADIPPSWRKKYFKPHGDTHMQVCEKTRSQVSFRIFNLMDPIVAKKPYHVVFCRNVMIYFDAPTKADLANRIYDVMAPGGYLFVGQTESLVRPTRFNYVMPSVYQKGMV